MATIPLQLAQHRLDTGSVVSYPSGSPVGAAMQGFGDELTAVAERYRQQKEQQEAFDAEIVRRQFDSQIAQAEDEAVQNAPADGSGLHDTMYGQVDPRTGQVIKSGLFDKLFDSTLPKIPESQRANFIRQKEALRTTGSTRVAAQQQARRDEYEQVEWTKVENIYTGSIAQSDPADTGTFEAIRQSGARPDRQDRQSACQASGRNRLAQQHGKGARPGDDRPGPEARRRDAGWGVDRARRHGRNRPHATGRGFAREGSGRERRSCRQALAGRKD
ncbi:hypothetical protein [Mesorhizobium sp.]|uniref:hypothetical protein n=1 Tax=Mesorhizobium sp. TaxID=1871066 RepID=UPI0025BB0B42|nr:hypothetical protein [Mesorhizobium sp.]